MNVSLSSSRAELPLTLPATEGSFELHDQFQKEVIYSLFRETSPGELQTHQAASWTALMAIEAQLSQSPDAATRETLQEALKTLQPVANDRESPFNADASLLCKIIGNLLQPDRVPVKTQLATLVKSLLQLGDENAILKNPGSREFNSILPGLAAISYDYGSIGRTLLFEGASHWIGLPTSDETQTALPDRCERLRNTMFGIPKLPADGSARLETMWEFDMALDELATKGKPTYEL